jgi:hypothetical protein
LENQATLTDARTTKTFAKSLNPSAPKMEYFSKEGKFKDRNMFMEEKEGQKEEEKDKKKLGGDLLKVLKPNKESSLSQTKDLKNEKNYSTVGSHYIFLLCTLMC